MAFSDYRNISQVQKEFKIRYHEERFITAQDIEPPTFFLKEFQFSLENIDVYKNDFEQGWGQCLVELVAAQKINDEASLAVYGIVTDGKLWEFGKLLGDTFTKNTEGFTVDNLARLFGVLNVIFQSISRGNEVGMA